MSVSPVLPFIDLPKQPRPDRAVTNTADEVAAASATLPDVSSTATSPTPARRRPAARTGLRPRPLVPTSLDEALQLGRAVVAARLAPRGMETPEACMIAILHGMEVGLSPMQSLQRIAVVNGRPTIWGDGALALVQASGLAVSISETITGDKPEQWAASCTVLRRGERQVVTRCFSVDDARRARLWGKAGPWSEYPQRMLQMRARAFALRDVFADVLGGLYLHEELLDGEESSSWQPIVHAESGSSSDIEPEHGFSLAGRSDEDCAAGSAPRPETAATPTAPSPHRERQKAPPPPWVSADGEGEFTAPIESEVSASLATSDAFEPADRRSGKEQVKHLPPARARSIDLRLRRPSATAARLRFDDHWQVRRPRALSKGKPRSIPTRRQLDPAIHDSAPSAESQPASQTGEGNALPTTPAQNLELLNDALCCAQDQETLDEIVEEFLERLDGLPGEDSRTAEAIIRRHILRVAALASTITPEGGTRD